ncbi:MAG: hypothetical protein AAB599_01000 [Patescibacteria group bacterium]
MKIIYTKHAIDKIILINRLGWEVSKNKVRQVIKDPKWKGSSHFGQETAIGLVGKDHILRIILEREGGIIRVITLHIARRGRYESEL